MAITEYELDNITLKYWDLGDTAYAESSDSGNDTSWGINHNWRAIADAIQDLYDTVLLADGTVELSDDWDIGDGNKIIADEIEGRGDYGGLTISTADRSGAGECGAITIQPGTADAAESDEGANVTIRGGRAGDSGGNGGDVLIKGGYGDSDPSAQGDVIISDLYDFSVTALNDVEITTTGGTITLDGASGDNVLLADQPTGGEDLAVATTKYVDDAVAGTSPGLISAYGKSSVPTGWLECDGSAVSRETYAALYAVIGDAFGEGDGSTTFHLPDLRGRFLRGYDDSVGRDPDAATRSAMNTGGNTGDNIGSVQDDAFQGHYHALDMRSSAISLGVNATPPYSNGNLSETTNVVQEPTNDGSNGAPRTTSETRPQNANVMYIIKY